MVNILQIDTSGNTGMVLLARDGMVVATEENTQSRDYAAQIHGMIDRVLSSGGITMKELQAVAVCAGPGSYTGLRIGLSVAKGICYALDIPLLLENKMKLLVLGEKRNNEGPVAVVLKAREQEFFMAVYDASLSPLLAPVHVSAEILPEKLKTYPDTLKIYSDIEDLAKYLLRFNRIELNAGQVFDNSLWAEETYRQFKSHSFATLHEAEPFYLKEVHITKKA